MIEVPGISNDCMVVFQQGRNYTQSLISYKMKNDWLCRMLCTALSKQYLVNKGRACLFSAEVKWAVHLFVNTWASPTGGKYIDWEKQVASNLRSSLRCKSYDAAVWGLFAKPTPEAQMYSQESMFCKSSASSLPLPDLLGATVNSGQNSKSHTALSKEMANGSDSCDVSLFGDSCKKEHKLHHV